MKKRVLKCQTCNRLTDIAELSKRPLPEEGNVKVAARVGCAFCGNTYFRAELIEER